MPTSMHAISQKARKEVFHKVKQEKHHIDMSNVCAIILGGGQGTRLFPLTQKRCKPAILFGGRYRLIDIPISNSINSHIHKHFVVTQFLSASLHQHLFHAYRSDCFGSIELLSAEQRPNKHNWFEGTADAIRQNLEYLIETPAEYFLILSGDQLYHMDFQEMVECAIAKDVDVLVATLAVNEKNARRMGIIKVNEDQHIIEFFEKPTDPTVLERLKTPIGILDKMGLHTSQDTPYLGSMGIYLFKREALFSLLQEDPREDFGKHLIPTKVQKGNIAAYIHEGYWEDIGTIESFFEANVALTRENPPFNLFAEHMPIFSTRYHLPGAQISCGHLEHSIICEGSIVEADAVSNAVIGQRAMIGKGSIIRDCYIMGNDFYSIPHESMHHLPQKLGIEESCVIKNAIIDKNVHIGKGVQLVNKNRLKHFDSDTICVRDGIIVVPSGVHIPDGFVF